MPTTGRHSVSTEPHTDLSAARTAPEWVVKELREIDPTLEIVYFGEGRWVVGSVSPNSYRQNIGHRMLQATRMVSVGVDSDRKQDRLKVAYLAREGMRFIKMYRAEGEAGMPWRRLINDVGRRDRNYRNALGDHLEEAEKQIDGTRDMEKTVETVMESARAKASDIVSKVFRNATQFLQDDDPLPQEGDPDGQE